MAKQKFSDLPPAQQRAIVVAGAVQLTLLAAALIDIRRRPQDQIKGPKPLWVGISFINTIGPLAYFFFGRKRHSSQAGPAEADSLTVDGPPAVDGSAAVDGSPGAAG
jgi:hypothetical protein